MTVTVIRHINPNGDADTVAGSYAKAVKDATPDDIADCFATSAWDAATGSIVTTIFDFS